MTDDDESSAAAAGWYRDADTDLWRWWDGDGWTDAARNDSNWRIRIMVSPLSLRVNHWVRNAAATGLVIAGAVTAYNFATGNVVPGAQVLLILGFPLVFFGQFWILAIFHARFPTRKEKGRSRKGSRRPFHPFVFFARGVSVPAAVALAVAFYLGCFVAFTAFPGPKVSPRPGTPGVRTH